jgi:hypothetical protein
LLKRGRYVAGFLFLPKIGGGAPLPELMQIACIVWRCEGYITPGKEKRGRRIEDLFSLCE